MIFEKNDLERLQQNLINLLIKHTYSYASDFIVDLSKMNDWNQKDELTGKYIMLFYENGTEFDKPDNDSILHNWGGVVRYEVDFDKYAKLIEEEYHFSNFSNLTHGSEKEVVIKRIEKDNE